MILRKGKDRDAGEEGMYLKMFTIRQTMIFEE
jgi:hypothetical protein